MGSRMNGHAMGLPGVAVQGVKASQRRSIVHPARGRGGAMAAGGCGVGQIRASTRINSPSMARLPLAD
eukprot:4540800-Prymnesium_polylepis.1